MQRERGNGCQLSVDMSAELAELIEERFESVRCMKPVRSWCLDHRFLCLFPQHLRPIDVRDTAGGSLATVRDQRGFEPRDTWHPLMHRPVAPGR